MRQAAYQGIHGTNDLSYCKLVKADHGIYRAPSFSDVSTSQVFSSRKMATPPALPNKMDLVTFKHAVAGQ